MIEQMILFGASGDLASRLLLPGMAQLVDGGVLPKSFRIVGAAPSEWTTEDFRQHAAEALAEHAADTSPDARESLVSMLTYRQADVTDRDAVRGLLAGVSRPVLVYLALPSGLLEAALTALSEAGLDRGDAVAVEKPFGTDLATARRLNEILHEGMPKPTVFRVDHFLSSELVQRVLALRFLNRIFEPVWSAAQVERIDIHWFERLGLEGRAAYYDHAGALKDMIQNHLLATLCLTAMEQPARLEAPSVRDARVEVLRAIPTPGTEQIRAGTVRGRYEAGTIAGRELPAYVAEPGVDPSRQTETYAAVRLEIASRRWAGVPVILRTGKALAADSGEIAVHFRPVPAFIRRSVSDLRPNVLRIGLMEPYVRLETVINGPDWAVEERGLALTARDVGLEPYANLIREMLEGDPMLFVRGDEAEESWRIIDPIVTAWKRGDVPLEEYPAGGQPPVGDLPVLD